MARRKAGAKSSSRRSYRRRYSRRRRYRRKYPRRSGKRFPRSTEVKSKSKTFSASIMPTPHTIDSLGATGITYKPGLCFIVGSDGDTVYQMGFSAGTRQGERVGAKIEPIKLRISGAISLVSSNAAQPTYAPNYWQVRLLVYQVKGGNSSFAPDNTNYHQLAMISSGDDGFVTSDNLAKLLMSFSSTSHYEDPVEIFTEDDWLANNQLGKVPLRRGIGGMCRVLYKKTFWINTQKNPIKQFRIVTRVPKRFIYPETTYGANDNATQDTPNNAVYILWMFQPGSNVIADIPRININYTVDCFFTDK